MKKLLVSLLAGSVLLAGCIGGQRDEKQSFIDATVEATCLIFQSENIFDPALEEEAKAVYEKYGFDASDDAAMTALTAQYEADQEVQDAIAAAIEECAGDFMSGFEDSFGDVDLSLEGEDVVVEEEAVVEEEDAVVEEEDVVVEEEDVVVEEEVVVE